MTRLIATLLFAMAATHAIPAQAWVSTDPDLVPTWNDPLRWTLNERGSRTLPDIDQVQRILLDSYDSWTAPSCSGFRYAYEGLSTRDNTNSRDELTTHGFLDSWPEEYGDPNSVIGITVGVYWQGGYIETDVNFNEDRWSFTHGQPAGFMQADLQAIATHEFGHSLGLGHPPVPQATMYASYDGTTNARTLHADDIDGVCALYPGGGGGGTTEVADDDAFEENDTLADAAPVRCGQVIAGHAADPDFYVVTTLTKGPLTATLRWPDASDDLDLYLIEGETDIDRSESERSTSEQVSAELPAGTFAIAVNNYAGTTDYKLEITCAESTLPPDPSAGEDEWEDNDEASQAAPISCGDRLDLFAAKGDQDWFSFDLPGSGTIQAEIVWPGNLSGDLNLFLVDRTDVLDESRGTTGVSEFVESSGLAAGTYGVAIVPRKGDLPYVLSIDCLLDEADDIDPRSGEDPGSDATDGPESGGCACSARSPVSHGGGWLAVGLLTALGIFHRRGASAPSPR